MMDRRRTGSLKGLSAVALREAPNPIPLVEELARQNKHGGFMCAAPGASQPNQTPPNFAKTARRRRRGI
jgi:hypothetical protein